MFLNVFEQNPYISQSTSTFPETSSNLRHKHETIFSSPDLFIHHHIMQ